MDKNLLEFKKRLNEERWSVAFTEASIKAWEHKKKHLENKLKEIRKEYGENNV